MPISVLHLLASNQHRGAETFGFSLHLAMREAGHDSRVAAIAPVDRAGESALAVPLLADSRFSVSGLRALRRAAADVDVVVAHGSSTLLACAVGLTGAAAPFVYLNIGDPRRWAAGPTRRVRVALLLRRAARVIAICDPAREALRAYYGLPAGRVEVIPNGRSASQFHPVAGRREELLARLGIGIDAGLLGCVGALSPEKRLDVAIKALTGLPRCHLVVVGDGPERASLQSLSDSIAPGRVHFLGAVPRPELTMTGLDAVLMTSESEGLPGVLIEAGLCGVPAVSTNVGWVDQVIVDGETGVLVPPDRPDLVVAAVRTVLTRTQPMGEAALQHCRANFELAVVTQQWEELLTEVARAGKHLPVGLRKLLRERTRPT